MVELCTLQIHYLNEGVVRVFMCEREKKVCICFGWYEKFECYKNEEVNKNKCMKFRWTKENLSQII
jgi:hypothetical protein